MIAAKTLICQCAVFSLLLLFFFFPLSASLCTWAFPAITAWFLSDSVGKLADGISIPCSQTNHTGANCLWSPKHCLINLLGWHAGLSCQLTEGADDTRYFHLLYPLQAWGRQRAAQEKSQMKPSHRRAAVQLLSQGLACPGPGLCLGSLGFEL